jgi:hypothetical protein
MELYIIFGVVAVLSVGPLFYNLWRHADREDGLAEHAKARGYTCVRNGPEGVLIHGVYKGYTFILGALKDRTDLSEMTSEVVINAFLYTLLDHRYRSDFERSDMVDNVSLPLQIALRSKPPAGLRVMRRGDALPRPPIAENQPVQTGIASFDKFLVVDAPDPAAARAFLTTPHVRDAVASLVVGGSFVLEGGVFTIFTQGMPDGARLERMLEQLVEVAARLDGQLSSATDDALSAFELPPTQP